MIDGLFQDEISRNLDARQQMPGAPAPPPKPGVFANVLGGLGGLPAGGLEAAAGTADQTYGFGQVMGSTGSFNGGGMFSTGTDAERAQTEEAHRKLMAEGVDVSSPAGDAFRVKAKSFMPDPETTGAAGNLVAGLLNFGGQGAAAMTAGPAGLVNFGVDQALNESDKLKQQGVDFNTRTAAGTVFGLGSAGSLVLPMSGATRLIRGVKGAAGGLAATTGQTEAERLILEHGGYDKIASQYDPLDPVALALGGLVPGVLGGAFGHAAKAPGEARAEPTHADVTLTPAEQAHSDAVEASLHDTNIAALKQELAAQKDPGSRKVLQAELDKLLRGEDLARAAGGDAEAQAAARTLQAADAINASRLTPADDIAGHDAHIRAVETAADQIAAGEPVAVEDIVSPGVEVPAVPEGSIRLYQPEETTEPQRFQMAEPEGPSRFVDVPESHPALQQGGVHVELPPEIAEQRRPMRPEPIQGERVTRLAAAADELRAARAPVDPDAPALRAPAEAAPREAAAKPERPLTAEAPGAAAGGEKADPATAHLEATTAEILRTNPDMLVHLDGMDAPMRVADLIDTLREQAGAESRDADLYEVAAQCAISL
jgi:hypothetical protein